jgi:hydroxymethylpyrimidine pyrophosphatase-like HAD family hydrolase
VINGIHGDSVKALVRETATRLDGIADYSRQRATKDRAIKTVLREFSLNEYELVVFGDQSNDIKCFNC